MEDKHDLIINAAESQFIRFGFRKTTMEDIAKAAGIGKATLYYYFKSKEDIFAEMVERVGQAGVYAIAEAARTGENSQVKLRIFGNSFAASMKEKIDYYATFREEILEMFPSVRKKQKNAEEYGVAALRGILQEGVQQRVFAISDVEATTRMLFLLMQELATRMILEENWATWKEGMNLFLDLIIKGVETRK